MRKTARPWLSSLPAVDQGSAHWQKFSRQSDGLRPVPSGAGGILKVAPTPPTNAPAPPAEERSTAEYFMLAVVFCLQLGHPFPVWLIKACCQDWEAYEFELDVVRFILRKEQHFSAIDALDADVRIKGYSKSDASTIRKAPEGSLLHQRWSRMARPPSNVLATEQQRLNEFHKTVDNSRVSTSERLFWALMMFGQANWPLPYLLTRYFPRHWVNRRFTLKFAKHVAQAGQRKHHLHLCAAGMRIRDFQPDDRDSLALDPSKAIVRALSVDPADDNGDGKFFTFHDREAQNPTAQYVAEQLEVRWHGFLRLGGRKANNPISLRAVVEVVAEARDENLPDTFPAAEDVAEPDDEQDDDADGWLEDAPAAEDRLQDPIRATEAQAAEIEHLKSALSISGTERSDLEQRYNALIGRARKAAGEEDQERQNWTAENSRLVQCLAGERQRISALYERLASVRRENEKLIEASQTTRVARKTDHSNPVIEAMEAGMTLPLPSHLIRNITQLLPSIEAFAPMMIAALRDHDPDLLPDLDEDENTELWETAYVLACVSQAIKTLGPEAFPLEQPAMIPPPPASSLGSISHGSHQANEPSQPRSPDTAGDRRSAGPASCFEQKYAESQNRAPIVLPPAATRPRTAGTSRFTLESNPPPRPRIFKSKDR